MQRAWVRHVHQVHGLCSREFWKIFATVREQTSECANKVLKATRAILQTQKTTFRLGHHWPTTVRTLRDRVKNQAGCFWDNVTQTHTVHFEGGGFRSVKFTFLDPCYVWIQQCVTLHDSGHALVFKPKVLRHPDTGEEIYGAGIEYGLLFRAASASIPAGGSVALMNLSWDGGDTGIGSRSASPICVQVMNTNGGSMASVGLVGYIPKMQVSDATRTKEEFKKANAHLLQVSVLEPTCGFKLFQMWVYKDVCGF